MKAHQFDTENEAQTVIFAQNLAPELHSGDIIFLTGNLGAGKTVFARSLIRSLSGSPELVVPSPTFTLLQTYDTPNGIIWHFDLYRLNDAEEIYELGWEDAITEGICLIEWPQRLQALAPQDHLTIDLGRDENNPDKRHISLTPSGAWRNRDVKRTTWL